MEYTPTGRFKRYNKFSWWEILSVQYGAFQVTTHKITLYCSVGVFTLHIRLMHINGIVPFLVCGA